MSTTTALQSIEHGFTPRMYPILDDTSEISLPIHARCQVPKPAGEPVATGVYVLPATGSWKTRTRLLNPALPNRRDVTTYTHVIIYCKHHGSQTGSPSGTEPSQPWKALEADEVSRPISVEEIIRRQADEFLAQLYDLDAAGELQAVTDTVFDYIDRLLSLGMFEVCNEILKRVQVERLSTSLMRSLLTITFAAKRYLKDREDFFERVAKEMTSKRGPEVADRLLRRLA